MEKINKLWKRWKKFGRKIADFQGRVLLTISYFLIVIPIGLAFKLFKRPKSSETSNWSAWKSHTDTLEEAKDQF